MVKTADAGSVELPRRAPSDAVAARASPIGFPPKLMEVLLRAPT
jgi:hypothetical protein